MVKSTLDGTDDDPKDDYVSLLEVAIEEDVITLDRARSALRRFLLFQAGMEGAGASVGDALASLAGQPVKNSLVAIILLRSLAVRGLLPESNSTNQIIRSTVEICEGALPEILDFFK